MRGISGWRHGCCIVPIVKAMPDGAVSLADSPRTTEAGLGCGKVRMSRRMAYQSSCFRRDL